MASLATAAGFRTDVEVLRGVALALVVVEHAWGLPAGGWLGVDVFFVLSGFVITRSLLDEHRRTGRIRLAAFAVRRLRRLLPAAVVVLAATVLGSALVWFGPRTAAVLEDAVASAVGTMNWHLLRQDADYFADSAPSPLRHFWSLSVEEQFYAVWPFVLAGVLALAATRRRTASTRAVVVGLVVTAFAVVAATVALTAGPLTGSAYFDTVARAWELLAGATVAALAPFTRALRRRRVAPLLRSVGVAALVIGVALAPVSPLPTLVVVPATALVLLSGDVRAESRVARAALRPWLLLGRVSYAGYLWHWPLLVFGAVLLPGPSGTVTAVLLTLLLAAVSTRFVEEPIRRLGRRRPADRRSGQHRASPPGRARLRPSTALLPLAAPAIVLSLSVVTMTLGDPASAVRRLTAPGDSTSVRPPFADVAALERAVAVGGVHDAASLANAATRASAPSAMQEDGCLVDLGEPLRVCGASERPDVLVVGDSTTVSWSPTVLGALPPGTTAGVAGVASCSAVLPTERVLDRWSDACRAAKAELHQLVDRTDPRVVVISAVTGEFREHLGDLEPRDATAAWEQSMTETIDALRQDHREVLVLSAPQYGPDTSTCPTRLHGFEACHGSVTGDAEAKRAAEADAVENAGAGATLVDAASWLCTTDGSRCPAVIDDTLVRIDQVHTTAALAERLVPVMRGAVDWDALLGR